MKTLQYLRGKICSTVTLDAKSNFLFVSQAIWNENQIVGNESLRAVFHGLFQLLTFFKFPLSWKEEENFSMQ